MSYIDNNTCDVTMIPISGHLTPWSVDGWVIESKYVQGGYIVVDSLSERNKLTDKSVYEERSALVHGTPVYVASEKKTYRWNIDREDWDEDALDAENIQAELDRLKETTASKTFVEATVNKALDTVREEMPTTVEQLTDANQYAKVLFVSQQIEATNKAIENNYFKKTETFDRETIDGKIAAVSNESIDYTDSEINKLKNEFPSKSYIASYVETIVENKLSGSGVVKSEYLENNYYDKLTTDTLLLGKASTKSVNDLTAKFNDYYTKGQVEQMVNNVEVDLSQYYTKIEVEQRISESQQDVDLSNYYTIAEVDQKLSSIVIPEVPEVDLSNYYTKDETARLVTTAVENVEIPTQVSAFTNDAGYLTMIPGEYVTETELAEKGYAVVSAVEDAITIANTFGDVVTSVAFGNIPAGTSLKGKTVKEVLELALGVQAPGKPAVETIIEEQIPAYTGTDMEGINPVTYKQLDTATASYTDQGFYTTTDASGTITNAGYQLVFEGNSDMDPQSFAIPVDAKIKTTYQYQPAMTSWLDQGFEGDYWIKGDVITKSVNGKDVSYQVYSYNVDGMSDAITATEYWRFEIEV